MFLTLITPVLMTFCIQRVESSPVRILSSKEMFNIITEILTECEEKKNAYEIIVFDIHKKQKAV